MKRYFLFILMTFLIFSCGKKGPLKPPPDPTLLQEKQPKPFVSPPKNLNFQVNDSKGIVILTFEGDWCESFRVYRYKKGDKKPSSPYAKTSINSFPDEFPLLNTPMIYEISCVVKDVESEANPAIEVVFR